MSDHGLQIRMYIKTIVNSWYHFQRVVSLRDKLDTALKDKLTALEDRLSLLVKLQDAEQRIVDTDVFMNIQKVFKSKFHKTLPPRESLTRDTLTLF